MSEINLLTNEEKLEQKLKFYTRILNVVLLLILLGLSGLSYYYSTLMNPLKLEKESLDNKISSLKSEIASYSDEELSLRELKLRFDSASKFESEKVLYEKIMLEVYERNISGGVDIKTININTDRSLVTVRVSSDSSSFKKFVDNLKAESVKETSIKNLFLNSGIAEEVNEVTKEYVVTVRFDKGALNAK